MRGAWRLKRAQERGLERLAGVRRRVRRGVALTFDDGPDPRFTPQILDVLGEAGVHATFFMLGDSARRHPDLVARAAAEGHAVGSHTRSHPDLWTLDLDAIRTEIAEGRAMVADAAGVDTGLFRPCKGHVDGKVVRAMRSVGVRPWLWSASPDDWRTDATVESNVAGLAGVVDGDVVLLHDAIQPYVDEGRDDRSRTVEALPHIIEAIRAKGLDLTTLECA